MTATELGLSINRLAIDVDTERLAMLLLQAGGAQSVTIVAGVNGTPRPLPTPQPTPPPPPPPEDTSPALAALTAARGMADGLEQAVGLLSVTLDGLPLA